MQTKISLKWSIINFDKKSIKSDISEILKARFNGEDFLEKSFDDLFDPYLLKDMDKWINRIKQAKKNREKIIIFWDYDVDWVTATSLLVHFFTKIWVEVSYRLPDRVKNWYWLKKYFVDEVKKVWASLIITVDCWTRDIDIIKYAKKIWIDVIVTDHHSVPKVISEEAIALINPKRLDCNYPNKNLSWAGVVFKLVHALSIEYFNKNEAFEYLKESVDIAAIGTVADCMNITWENRIIVKEWLKQVKKSRSRWIRILIEDQINNDLDADIFSFTIGPKINAPGRMDTPYLAINLILNNSNSVYKTVSKIEKLNTERKILTKDFTNDALSKINNRDNLLFYISPSIPHGIMGIVAWRITEQFYKPSIALRDEWDKLIASCRWPDYFSVVDILENYKDMFINFGGHKQAAWFSISKDKFWEFKTKILQEVNKIDFSNNKKEIVVDRVVRLEELWFNFLKQINVYKPFWIWNTRPIFMVDNLNYEKLEFLGNKSRDHLKFTTKHWFKIIWFFIWDFYEKIKRSDLPVSIIFELCEDSWMWNKNLMLRIIDVVLG